MRIAAAAGIGVPAQGVLQRRFVQRIVQLADGGGGVAERRVRGDVFDALAVDINFAAVLQALQVLFPG
nr:Uncharacterised protein [Raoultella sp. NCTC 9187]